MPGYPIAPCQATSPNVKQCNGLANGSSVVVGWPSSSVQSPLMKLVVRHVLRTMVHGCVYACILYVCVLFG